jgi:nickel transport protein
MAHKVTIFALVRGDTVFTQSKVGGKPAKNASVVINDTEGHKLLEGQTDEEGAFSFEIPDKKGLTVVVNASMGHQAEWVISAEELSGRVDVSKSRVPQGPRLVEVIGGVSCIVGLVVVALYFTRRRNKKEK